MNGVKSIYVNSLACVRVEGFESECFRFDGCVRQVYITSPWLFNVYMDTVMKDLKSGWGGRKRIEIAWPLLGFVW